VNQQLRGATKNFNAVLNQKTKFIVSPVLNILLIFLCYYYSMSLFCQLLNDFEEDV